MGKMMDTSAGEGDRPALTRSWIVTAFNRLVLGRRYETLSVGEVSRRAGVGRSTFYEHFRDKDDVLRQAIGPILAPLADAAVGAGDARRVQAALEHIADQRVRARAILDGPARAQVERALADLVCARLADVAPSVDAPMQKLESVRLAGAHVAVIRAWLMDGSAGCSAAAVALMLTEGGPDARLRGAGGPPCGRASAGA